MLERSKEADSSLVRVLGEVHSLASHNSLPTNPQVQPMNPDTARGRNEVDDNGVYADRSVGSYVPLSKGRETLRMFPTAPMRPSESDASGWFDEIFVNLKSRK